MVLLLDRRSIRVGYRVVTARWIGVGIPRRRDGMSEGLLTVDEGEAEVVVR